MTTPDSRSGPWLASDDVSSDAKRYAPATLRNREAIVAVLEDVLSAAGLALEIASGSGEHIVHFARHFPSIDWQPSDPDPAALASIASWATEAALPNVLRPLMIDAVADAWPLDQADALLCINMIHISPWAATQGLMRGASRLLAKGAPLFLYGPFIRDGVETAASNIAFDASLRERDSRWGLRKLSDVTREAEAHGLDLDRIVAMPANNLSVVYRRR